MHKDIGGKWNRLLTMDTIRVSGVREETGSGVTEWLVAGSHRVLQMIDPNSGQGWDDKKKQRYQYVMTDAGLLERMLPPESVGDVWRGETSPRPFTPIDRPASNYIMELLTT